jgi:8-oxo-dGTP pyrophosphatase MutT (NUDIX family)
MQIRDFPVPEQLARSVRAWLDDPTRQPAAAKPAATVMLVRDQPPGPAPSAVQVFMLRRVASMAFAPLTMVFPGGGVDERDADRHLPWCGPSPGRWAELLRAPDERTARELVVAAAREIFEECGVLLAGPDPTSVVADVSDPTWHARRAALVSRELSFAELLIDEGLVLRSDLLRARAHWVTPEFEPRRFDTRFFAALVPPGQVPDDQTSEADLVAWVDPVALLADADAGRAIVLPPTRVCLEQVAAASTAAGFLASGPPVAQVIPVLARNEHGPVLRCSLPL